MKKKKRAFVTRHEFECTLYVYMTIVRYNLQASIMAYDSQDSYVMHESYLWADGKGGAPNGESTMSHSSRMVYV